MKITPMVSYKKPAYPTYEESKADAGLLKNIPRRWGKNGSIASLVGTGILIHVGAGCREATATEDATVKIVEPVEHDGNVVTNVVRAIPATRVAPMLEEALANDGRGGFGCIAVSAPVFLSENEALDLIQAELEKTGLKFHDMVKIDGLHIPDREAASKREYSMPKKEGTDEIDWEEFRKFKMKPLTTGTYSFDLGTKDKSVVVQFLRKKDFDLWKDEPRGGWSSYNSFNFAELATLVSDTFKQRDDGAPVIIGLFFEPSTYPEKGGYKADDATKDRAREKLRAQVLHFVDYLKQEGVVE